MSSVYGFDIGGANVKFYDSDRDYAASIPFRLWKQPAKLADFLRANFSILNPSAQIAITMTAELCDCFESKREGVNSIANSVCQAFGSERVQFYARLAIDFAGPTKLARFGSTLRQPIGMRPRR
jgi:(4-(4-[2-(gamma-L-glutamylamino)ethyl]phenoxymethyl)furan-2-yl)methanamine synthase